MIAVDLISAATATSSLNSIGFKLGDLQTYSAHVDFSGSNLAGTLNLQASNDNSDWVDITGSSQAITSAGSHVWNVTSAQYTWFRVVWTFSSGTGTITVHVTAKTTVVKIAGG